MVIWSWYDHGHLVMVLTMAIWSWYDDGHLVMVQLTMVIYLVMV